MGFFESMTSLFISDAYAEEPQQETEQDNQEGGEEGADTKAEGAQEGGEGEEKSEEGGDEEGGEEGGDDAGGDEGEEEEEDEEEEDEPEDPLPALHEECAKTKECRPHKHEYEECVARVTAAQEDEGFKGPHEDCVEEFFEYTHCVSQCAAPKLFKLLK